MDTIVEQNDLSIVSHLHFLPYMYSRNNFSSVECDISSKCPTRVDQSKRCAVWPVQCGIHPHGSDVYRHWLLLKYLAEIPCWVKEQAIKSNWVEAWAESAESNRRKKDGVKARTRNSNMTAPCLDDLHQVVGLTPTDTVAVDLRYLTDCNIYPT